MFLYLNLHFVECVLETKPFAKLYASVENGTLHINLHKLHFLANRTRRGWKTSEIPHDAQQPLQIHRD